MLTMPSSASFSSSGSRKPPKDEMTAAGLTSSAASNCSKKSGRVALEIVAFGIGGAFACGQLELFEQHRDGVAETLEAFRRIRGRVDGHGEGPASAKGFCVSSFTRAAKARISSGARPAAGMTPRPPASDTAATSSGVAMPCHRSIRRHSNVPRRSLRKAGARFVRRDPGRDLLINEFKGTSRFYPDLPTIYVCPRKPSSSAFRAASTPLSAPGSSRSKATTSSASS